MNYNFDELTHRRDTASYKWDSTPDPEVIPLWVADMDFRTAPAVVEALRHRVESGIFGYVRVPDSYYEALIRWFEERHGWTIRRQDVVYTSGVVPAISAIIKALTSPGDGVVIQTPAYNCFFSSVRNNGCRVVENPLRRVDTPAGFTYEMDFDNLERVLAESGSKLLLLCNPHNPSGRVWTRDELTILRDLCRTHGVMVVSDEIHCELTHPGFDYLPYALVDREAIVCNAPSKAFNTAGLQIANIVVPDDYRRMMIDKAININEVCDVNPFGVIALQAAYNNGRDWLDALNAYLYDNYLYLRDTLAALLPQLPVCDSQSTYLAWIDVSPVGLPSTKLEETLKQTEKVWVNAGDMYAGEGFVRINFACPRKRLEEGLKRFCNGVKNL